MRTYERNNVHVDQCTECRGVFLDRGELERLMAAEAAYSPSATPPPARVERSIEAVRERGYDRDRSNHGSYRKRKKSFFEELFD
ncbi:MAG: zf-TFIIB domain-containing protein [Nocardioides sp.]